MSKQRSFKKKQAEMLYFEDKMFKPALLSEKILKLYKIVTLNDTEEMFYYDNGMYKPKAELLIKEEAKKHFEDITKHQTNEVIHHIQAQTFKDRNSCPEQYINVKNGLFNIKTYKLEKHNPKIFTTTQLPIKYNKYHDCPAIRKFLSEVLHEEDIPVIQEAIGYCLLRDYPIHKSFMFVGSGSNGKSTLLNLIKHFLSNNNVCSISLQDLEANRFAKAQLFNKLANLYPDLPAKALHQTGMFKMAVGNDTITAEHKFKHHFNFVNHAKMIFSCNKLPETRDNSDAFYRRWVIIMFSNVFSDNANPHLLNELITEQEISGLFNWAIDGLKRLMANNRFSYNKTTEEIGEMYERMSNSLSGFVMDCTEFKADGYISKEEFYNCYVDYCKKNKLPAKSKTEVSKELPRLRRVETGRKGERGNQKHSWIGISLIEKQSSHGSQLISHFNKIGNSYNIKVEKNMTTDTTKHIEVKEETLEPIGYCELCGKKGLMTHQTADGILCCRGCYVHDKENGKNGEK